jgi:hypothetical protein
MSFKIVPSEEGGSQDQAILDHNLQYVELSKVASRLNDIPEAQLNAIFGRVAGTMDVRLRKSATALGLNLEGVKTPEHLEQVLGAYEIKINELNSSIEGLTKDRDEATKAEVAKLTQRIVDLEALNAKISKDFQTVATEKETIASEFTKKQREITISNLMQLAEKDFVIVDDSNTKDAVEYEKSKHKWTIDDENNQIVYDSEGKAILSSKGTGFASFKEVTEMILTKKNAHKKISGVGMTRTLEQLPDMQPIAGRNPASKK